ILVDSSAAKRVGLPARKSDIRAGKSRWSIGDDTSFPPYGYVCLTVVHLRTPRERHRRLNERNPNDEARRNDERSSNEYLYCYFIIRLPRRSPAEAGASSLQRRTCDT